MFCISNSGYYTLEKIQERIDDAKNHDINLHVWTKNEIDNYAININVIVRYLEAENRIGVVDKLQIVDKIKEILLSIFKRIESLVHNNSKNVKIDEINYRVDEPLNIISGKEFFNALSLWTRKEYGLSISARKIVPYFYPNEVPDEIKDVIDALMI